MGMARLATRAWMALHAVAGLKVARPAVRVSRTGPPRDVASPSLAQVARAAASGLVASVFAGALVAISPDAALAVSGGGKDYSGATIKGEDFSGGKYNNLDFSGADASRTVFKNAQLRGTRFFKSNCQGADFTGADLSAASLEGANLEGTVLRGAIAVGTAFSPTLDDVADVSDVDFTDAIMRPDVQKRLCARADAKGTNAKTGVDTRESLMCLD